MQFTNEAKRQGRIRRPIEAVPHGRNVVGDLAHVVERAAMSSPASRAKRSVRDDWVPSIWEESSASSRT